LNRRWPVLGQFLTDFTQHRFLFWNNALASAARPDCIESVAQIDIAPCGPIAARAALRA